MVDEKYKSGKPSPLGEKIREQLLEFTPETRLEIQAKMEEYEFELLHRFKDHEKKDNIILQKKKSFVQKLIDQENDDENRDIEEIRKEESFLINTNMMLTLFFVVLFISPIFFINNELGLFAKNIVSTMSSNFSWFYILISSTFLIFLIFLASSRFGAVVLGHPEDIPEFSNISWYSMLFSAGMGVGILFWGGGEPIDHFINPPLASPGSLDAARMSMSYSIFHWGLHAWGIYTIAAVGVAYYGFRKRKKYLISSSIMDVTRKSFFRKFLKILADLISTLGVIFGVASSLALGTLQILKGLNHVWNIDTSSFYYSIGVVIILAICFLLSASTGLNKGIKILSNINMMVAVLLMTFLFLVGPSLFILKVFVDTLGTYVSELPHLSFKLEPFVPAYEKWMSTWTLSHFGWWIVWSPFVGIFIARISKGRTIRELILGTLIAPTLFTILWFSVFGGSALFLELHTTNGISEYVRTDVAKSLFALLQNFPLYKITSIISIFLIFTFLVTSADSAVFVISMMTSKGDLDPSTPSKITWGIILSIVTILLLIGGGILTLQAVTLTFAFPLSIILILIAVSLTIRLSFQVKQKRI